MSLRGRLSWLKTKIQVDLFPHLAAALAGVSGVRLALLHYYNTAIFVTAQVTSSSQRSDPHGNIFSPLSRGDQGVCMSFSCHHKTNALCLCFLINTPLYPPIQDESLPTK